MNNTVKTTQTITNLSRFCKVVLKLLLNHYKTLRKIVWASLQFNETQKNYYHASLHTTLIAPLIIQVESMKVEVLPLHNVLYDRQDYHTGILFSLLGLL